MIFEEESVAIDLCRKIINQNTEYKSVMFDHVMSGDFCEDIVSVNFMVADGSSSKKVEVSVEFGSEDDGTTIWKRIGEDTEWLFIQDVEMDNWTISLDGDGQYEPGK